MLLEFWLWQGALPARAASRGALPAEHCMRMPLLRCFVVSSAAPLQAKQEEALTAAAAEKAAADAATVAAQATIAEREAAIGALQEEVAGLKENLEALQAQLGERWWLLH